MTTKKVNNQMGVPEQVFDQFLAALEAQKIPVEVVEPLREILTKNKQISVEALKEALFNDGTNI